MKNKFIKINQKFIFLFLVALSFLFILVYNVFTPQMMDDIRYIDLEAGAHSIVDLIKLEYEQYMGWTGRSVGHFILRCFLMCDKMVFNIFNSIAFVALTLFMYYNIEGRKKWDVFVYLLINLLMWIFGVSFSQTVLWETGACNYLWGSAIIMGYISLFKYCMNKDCSKKADIAISVGLFILGIFSGWCNENTSGGCILLLCIWIAFYVQKHKKMRIWMITGVVGNLIGFLIMILAPGNINRKLSVEEGEEHTGLMRLVSRILKCNNAIYESFFVLIAICIAAFILVRLQKAVWEKSKNMLIFFFVFVATCYALVLAPEPMRRAYFGAGIFLIISCIQGIVDIIDNDIYIRAVKLSAVSIMSLYFLFTYIECGADLARIYRDSNERVAYIQEQSALGNKDITVPVLHPDFENKYSAAYLGDLSTEDREYWINKGYAGYYGVGSILAVPRDEWQGY